MKKQVIEYAGIPVGITIPDGDRVKFIAVKYPVIDLDGGSYRNISELQAAIHQHMVKSDPVDQAEFLGAANTPVPSSARRVFNAA
jgi:hypothetical protein